MNRADADAKIKKLARAMCGDAPRMPTFAIGNLVMPQGYSALAIFGVGRPSAPTSYVRRMPLVSSPTLEANYSGPLLTQVHADLLMALVALASGAEGDVTIRMCELERLLERSAGAHNRAGVRDMMRDIMSANVEVVEHPSGRRAYGPLLPFVHESGGADDDPSVIARLRIEQDLVDLLLRGCLEVGVQERKRLARQPVAQWLQLYLPNAPRVVQLDELQRLMRAVGPAYEFRRRLREALEALEAAESRVGRWQVSGGGDALVRLASA